VVKRRLDAVGAHVLGLVLIEPGGGHSVARNAKAKKSRRTKVRSASSPTESRANVPQPEPEESDLESGMEAVADPEVGLSRRVGPTK
jgi:hypothetical protein